MAAMTNFEATGGSRVALRLPGMTAGRVSQTFNAVIPERRAVSTTEPGPTGRRAALQIGEDL